MPEARLTRQLPDGSIVPWQLNDANVPAGDALPTDPVADAVARARLQTIIERLTSGVPLAQATLDALETISLNPAQVTDLKTVTVSNMVAAPETGLARDTTVQAVRDRADFPLPANQMTELKNVAITNFPVSTEVTNDVGNPIPVSSPVRETRLDYGTRTDANPVYVGDAMPGTVTSAPTWNVLRLEYDVSNRLIRKQVQQNIAWDDRSVGW